MAEKLSLKDLYKIGIGGSSGFLPGMGFNPTTMTLPNGGGQYQSQTPKPNMSVGPAPVAPAPAPVPSKPVFAGAAPVAPAAPTAPVAPAQASNIPPQWIRPDGGFYTPEEVAANIAKAIPKTGETGDIANLAGNEFAGANKTAEQMQSELALLNNARNDVAVGETDPFGIASDSGIAYTPAELAAIEKSYAGIYDPAIATAHAKLESKQKSDEEERAHKYELEKMEKQFEYDKKLKQVVTPGSGGGSGSGSSNQMIDNERAAQTLFQNNPIVKDYNTIIGQKNSIDRVISNGVGGPADVNAIFSFMKALDPNSVVRESEYDKAAASGNLFQGMWTKFNGYFKDKGGFLPDNVREEFQNLINQRLIAKENEYNNVANQTREIVQRQGLNPNNVVIDFSQGVAPSATAPADPNWMSNYNYAEDLKFAKEAIAGGADPEAVKARLQTKYKTVEGL